MALQRPVPPPRRSKLPKTFSCDAEDLGVDLSKLGDSSSTTTTTMNNSIVETKDDGGEERKSMVSTMMDRGGNSIVEMPGGDGNSATKNSDCRSMEVQSAKENDPKSSRSDRYSLPIQQPRYLPSSDEEEPPPPPMDEENYCAQNSINDQKLKSMSAMEDRIVESMVPSIGDHGNRPEPPSMANPTNRSVQSSMENLPSRPERPPPPPITDHHQSIRTKPPSMDDQKNRSQSVIVENPGYYESRTIPFRSRPPGGMNNNARATSNLIWFQSGVPPEFKTTPTMSMIVEKENSKESIDHHRRGEEISNRLAFSPLEESNSPTPVAIPPPLFPAVTSLYPKLPPSPVLADAPVQMSNVLPPAMHVSTSSDSNFSPSNNAHISPATRPICSPPTVPPISKSISPATGGRMPPPPPPNRMESAPLDRWLEKSMDRPDQRKTSPSLSTNRSSNLMESFENDEDENFRRAIGGSVKLDFNMPSLNGSMASSGVSNGSQRSPTNGSVRAAEESWIREGSSSAGASVDAATAAAIEAANVEDRLRLMPIGTNICNVGWLNKLGSKKKETSRRFCALRNGVFDIYLDDSSDKLIESISCKSVEMVYIRLPTDLLGYDGDAIYIFTISFLADNGRKLENWTFSADRQDDLLAWMTLLTKCIVQSEAADMCESIDRAGPLYLKKGTTSDWEPGWFVMRGKVLLYAAVGDPCCYEVDIRKVIRIRTVTDSNDCCPMIQSQVPFAFVVSTEGSALYAQSVDVTTSKLWKDTIEKALMERTGLISEQRLTTDDIPIMVEKCISFVAVYGLSVEGIYRHNGTLTKSKVLFELFMKDPHDIHLRIDEYTVHDVSSVLKRYFRQLDEPLITYMLRPRFIEKSGLSERGSRIMAYKRLLGELPLVNYHTLRKLLRHLKTVTQHAAKNMMNTQNLAAIFGPTLFSVDGEVVEEGSSSFVSASQAINIIADMIISCDELFSVDNEELQKEKKIQEALQRIESHNLNKTPSQLLLPIHVFDKDANVFNMPINNKTTAGDVCTFAVAHKKLTNSPDKLALFEVICGGQLERILNFDEKLLEIVGRWSSWPVEERAANYLIVKIDYIKERMESMSNTSLLTSCDVQLSESKSFRKCTFQCSKGEILLYKNAKGTKPLQSWPVDKVFWYFGCETRRQPPSKHCLTFIEKEAVIRRSKSAPFFGRCISFHDEADLLKWLTTVTLSNRPLRADY